MFTRQPCGVVQKVVDKAEAIRGNIARAPGWHSHASPQLRTAPADERHPHQLPVTLAGTLIDSDDAHIPGACAGSNWEPCGRAAILDSA